MFQELVLLYQKEHPLLPGGDGYTVFAPTIQALEDLKSTFLEKLLLDATIRNKVFKCFFLIAVNDITTWLISHLLAINWLSERDYSRF